MNATILLKDGTAKDINNLKEIIIHNSDGTHVSTIDGSKGVLLLEHFTYNFVGEKANVSIVGKEISSIETIND